MNFIYIKYLKHSIFFFIIIKNYKIKNKKSNKKFTDGGL